MYDGDVREMGVGHKSRAYRSGLVFVRVTTRITVKNGRHAVVSRFQRCPPRGIPPLGGAGAGQLQAHVVPWRHRPQAPERHHAGRLRVRRSVV